ncbi:hypothetical protein [Pseudomonas sp. NPDC087817]|uniref:hypothetical protein n=1 Tax=Pseudomonas sp. NPDC087817 TaxID=3364451 RepID=UPI0038146B77
MGFSATMREWFGQDEYGRVFAVCEGLLALHFLAMTPEEQRGAIPYCPACETWSEVMLPLERTLTACAGALPMDIRTRLQSLWEQCNGLTEAAFHCDDWFMFDHAQWQPLRVAAEELKQLMEWQDIEPFREELLEDCRNAIRGIKRPVTE